MINQETDNKKTVIITGGNTGLGYECAKNIAQIYKNSQIILACRNNQKAHEAVKSLISETGNPEPAYEKAEWLAYPDKTDISLSGTRRYTTSKLCNLYCTYELSERITLKTKKHITVNAFNPGMMPGTGLAQDHNVFARFAWKHILPVLTIFKHNVNTVAQSGKLLAMLITDPGLDHITGKYFDGGKQANSSELSYNKQNREDLWKTSMELVNLTKDETILA
jgi:hypothetical protein